MASQDVFAYKSLWDGMLELLLWFIVGSVTTGVVGTQLIRIITRPLAEVVDQAHAITERRFVTIKVPRTPEFKSCLLYTSRCV